MLAKHTLGNVCFAKDAAGNACLPSTQQVMWTKHTLEFVEHLAHIVQNLYRISVRSKIGPCLDRGSKHESILELTEIPFSF